MTTVLIAGLGDVPGKTMLCAGLAQGLAKRGSKVGYFKPIAVTEAKPGPDHEDRDAAFMRRAFAIGAAVSDICPVALAIADLSAGLPAAMTRVKEALARASQGKDVMLAEGLSVTPGSPQLQAVIALSDALQAKVVLVVPCSGAFPAEAASVLSALGPRVAGVIANLASPGQVEMVRSSWPARLGPAKLLGVIPEDRRLQAASVLDVAGFVAGGLPADTVAGQELVENLQLGVLTADPVSPYFQSKQNKAVVVRSDRPDLQLAALATSVRCLVLTGKEPPFRDVVYRAREAGVALIQAPGDTDSVVGKLEAGLEKVRFRQERKLPVLESVLAAALDWNAVSGAVA